MIIFFLHSALLDVLSSYNPACVISLLHAYFHLRFGRPLLLFPAMSTSSILLNKASSFIRLAWPYHFSRFSVIVWTLAPLLLSHLMCSFRILSLLVTLHIHISILISFTSSRDSCPLVVAHVSVPYKRAGILRGRVVKGVGHLDHVWSFGVREVVSSIPDRMRFSSDQVTGKVFSSEHAFPSKFWIYLEHCPREEVVITDHLRLSSMR